jgi:NCS2 family nucleobase:cation symporter-2
MTGKTRCEYGVDDVPPLKHLLLLSLQHVMMMFVALGFAIVFTAQLNTPP